MFRRLPSARWEVETGLFKRSRTLVAGSQRLFTLADDAFISLIQRQMVTAAPIAFDRRGRRWWMYRDEFFVEDEELTADDVTALAIRDAQRRKRRVDQAHALQHVTSGPIARTPLPVEVREAVWQRDRGRCTVCASQRDLEFDHIIPVAMGGGNGERNIQLLCGPCNRRKAATLG